jgi:hypothetical protein
MFDDIEIIVKERSQNGFYDCCVLRDKLNQNKLIFANNESGSWKITNQRNINPIRIIEICSFLNDTYK